jgi:hypothetical protein
LAIFTTSFWGCGFIGMSPRGTTFRDDVRAPAIVGIARPAPLTPGPLFGCGVSLFGAPTPG